MELSNICLGIFYLVLALLPGLLWLGHYYSRDIYEPEPKILVAKLFGTGILGFFLAYSLQSSIYSLVTDFSFLFKIEPHIFLLVKAFLIVALSEEVIKLALVYVFIFYDAEFDEPMDGVVYSIACALGFATMENASYMYTYGSYLWPRMLFSCFLHAGCSGLAGYYLGLAKFTSTTSPYSLITKGLILSWALHGLYDYIVFSKQYLALVLIIILLWAVKNFLDSGIYDALERSPYKHPNQLSR